MINSKFLIVQHPESHHVFVFVWQKPHISVSFSSCRYQCFILKGYLSKASISSMTGSVSSQQEDRLIYCLFRLPGQSVSDSAEWYQILSYIPVMSHWNLLVRCLCVLFHSFRVTRVTSRRSFNTLFSNITSGQAGHRSKAHDAVKWKKYRWDSHVKNNKLDTANCCYFLLIS